MLRTAHKAIKAIILTLRNSLCTLEHKQTGHGTEGWKHSIDSWTAARWRTIYLPEGGNKPSQGTSWDEHFMAVTASSLALAYINSNALVLITQRLLCSRHPVSCCAWIDFHHCIKGLSYKVWSTVLSYCVSTIRGGLVITAILIQVANYSICQNLNPPTLTPLIILELEN